MGVYVLVNPLARIDHTVIGVYSSLDKACAETRSYLMGTFNIDEDEVEEHVDAVFNGDYDSLYCSYKEVD